VKGRGASEAYAIGLVVYASLVAASCGGIGASVFGAADAGGGAPQAGSPGATSGGSLGSGDASACASGLGIEGCTCSTAGQTAACWTGPPDMRHVGACHDGTAVCVQTGELGRWGPCTGEQLNCGTPPPPPPPDEAGTDGASRGGGEDAGEPCGCNPGTIIWCDEDCVSNIYCSSTGQKTCLPDGTWSACQETMNSIPPGACELVGYGCSDCQGGRGFYVGDCQAAFPCTIWQPSNCSVQATVNNGHAVVTCNCN
jgi:hypothetical protein